MAKEVMTDVALIGLQAKAEGTEQRFYGVSFTSDKDGVYVATVDSVLAGEMIKAGRCEKYKAAK